VSEDPKGYWVQFFHKTGRTKYTLQEKEFFILRTDVVGKLEEPTLEASGSRIYFNF
jgi:hypothetical protein